jgi:HEAT repeats
MTLRLAKWIVLASLPTLGLTGCSFFTVDARSGTDALPVDLRSSSDDARPSVGVPNVPATQPGVIAGMGRGVRAVTVGAPSAIYEMATVGRFKDAARNLRAPDADVRRNALVTVASRSYGQGLPYTDVYRTTAQIDGDGLVRATAVRAINRVRDEESDAVLVSALADGHPQVRLEAAKALANLPTPSAEAPLRSLAQSNDQDIDTRIAALDALRHYPSLETQRALVGQLNSNSFALAWQARRSLYLQTDRDFRYDEAAWLNYLASK